MNHLAYVKRSLCLLSLSLALPLFASAADAEKDKTAKPKPTSYRELILSHQPTLYWDFEESTPEGYTSASADKKQEKPFQALVSGQAPKTAAGPRPSEFPLFDHKNKAAQFKAGDGFLKVVDPGEKSPLDFTAGDEITIEAWVNLNSTDSGRHYYIIGKGRTNRKGVARDNQNYGLRVTGSEISFLFRGKPDKKDVKPNYHRWTSTGSGISAHNWHHVAVTYTFGKKKSLKAYVDGQSISGKWDMGGDTTYAPVVDNDEVWIGSSMGGSARSSFDGLMDELAVYRKVIPEKEIKAHFKYVAPKPRIDWTAIPSDRVQVDIYEGIPNKKSWSFRPPRFAETFTQPHFTLIEIPNRYSAKGVKVDRPDPFLVRAMSKMTLPKGKKRILVRARNGSRLYIDDELVLETPFHNISGSAHGKVFDVDLSLSPNIRPLHRGDHEKVVEYTGDGKPHRVRFEMIVGGSRHRPDFGETAVFIGDPGKDFQLLTPSDQVVMLTDVEWLPFERQYRYDMIAVNAERRREASQEEDQYWAWRHKLAKEEVLKQPQVKVPAASKGLRANNAVDHFINRRLSKEKAKQSAPLSDLAFLRRLSLDTTGTVPAPALVKEYLAQKPEARRSFAIERLLNDPGWADNWVGYWQDVLAENPNIVNPTLNNTGPFRWWIHESFYDNKPFDRFLTELVMMEGSKYFGGPAGFEMASQNDAPMAAKAHIIGQAFLGLNMKCARCHDAPFHDFKQRDLFSLAAMLKRSPQGVPKTSSIPGFDPKSNSMLVSVTLLPGENVTPKWTFEELVKPGKFPANYLRSDKDTREQLAAIMTSPQNERFANVIVNRVWKRYMGHGLVEPVDDWDGQEPSHPELLKYLSQQFVIHGYDLKYLSRLVFESDLYQREASTDITKVQGLFDTTFNFSSPVLRRMEAEQIVDSLFAICGKPLDAGRMCIDIDGSRDYHSSLDLGTPRRAWQFTSPSNERDRPSLALPFGQPFITLMKTFGWRDTRQSPLTTREYTSTALQPAILANGVLGQRFTRLSDDSAFTELALQDQPLEALIKESFLKALTREPTPAELKLFTELLQPGYAERVNRGAEIVSRERLPRNLVGWSNHLSPRANEIKVELEAAVKQGDPPTKRLNDDWRNRYEDMLWSMLNSPEFIFVP
ncbi:hypothetical protein Enr10x_03270 [Gimesia panareensis]|uniref:LamG-like jellyroll fold domain-containing protein n=1 Tax=Gimesia panareensis TaxID=2527978 RepID=A0A517Q085_9PLAN|nr:DUF1553 domain-containing protein [Gimesia panareensis]QDT25033.1 hypothetical protein Enr10x_03270 [Gimesia panareensis]